MAHFFINGKIKKSGGEFGFWRSNIFVIPAKAGIQNSCATSSKEVANKLMFFFKKSNYEYSNSVTKIKMPISDTAVDLTQKLLVSQAADERQELGEELLDELSDLAGIEIVELNIVDDNQIHRKRDGKIVMKRYGVYKVSAKAISIHNRTAARGQILAAKSFVDTLLHEWLHHYDFKRLKLNSIHSRGFYLRLNDLKTKLRIPTQKQS